MINTILVIVLTALITCLFTYFFTTIVNDYRNQKAIRDHKETCQGSINAAKVDNRLSTLNRAMIWLVIQQGGNPSELGLMDNGN